MGVYHRVPIKPLAGKKIPEKREPHGRRERPREVFLPGGWVPVPLNGAEGSAPTLR
jgi:hypothetical protein